jgi:hypothetical protein
MAQNELNWIVSDDDSSGSDSDSNNIDSVVDENIYVVESKNVKPSSPLRINIATGNENIYSNGGASAQLPPATSIPPLLPPPPLPLPFFNGNFQQRPIIMATPPPPSSYYPPPLPPAMQQGHQQHYNNYYYNSHGVQNLNRPSLHQQPQQISMTTKLHKISADSPISDSGENELEASTRYVSKWSPSLFNSYGEKQRTKKTEITLRSQNTNAMQANGSTKMPQDSQVVNDSDKDASNITTTRQQHTRDTITPMQSHYLAEIEHLKLQIETLSSTNGNQTNVESNKNNSYKDENIRLAQKITQLQSDIQFLHEEERKKYVSFEQERMQLKEALGDAKKTIEQLKAVALEETEESLIRSKNIVQKLEDTFHKREENLENSLKSQGIALQKALANEVTIQAAFNSLKAEKEKLENEVNKWSSSTNRFRMERDDLAEQNSKLKRQLHLDSTNLTQTEYLNQKLQNEVNHYKSILEQKQRLVKSSSDKIEALRTSVLQLQEQNKEYDNTIMELRMRCEVNMRNQEMNANYKYNNSSQIGQQKQQQRHIHNYRQGLQPPTNHAILPTTAISAQASTIVNDKNLYQNYHDRRKHQGGGAMGREFNEDSRYDATSPTGNFMVNVSGRKAWHGNTKRYNQLPKQQFFSSSPERTSNDSNKVKNDPVIESSIFPMPIEEESTKDVISNNEIIKNVGHDDNKQQRDIDTSPGGIAYNDITQRVEKEFIPPPQSSSTMSFQEAMENAKRKKAASAPNSTAASNQIPLLSPSTTSVFSTQSVPTSQKEAAKFAANHCRPHFKIEDPPSSKVDPIKLLSEEDKRQVRLQRVKRYEAAPFATEHSLNLQRKQMSEIENQLVKLGLEKTLLETELMKNESLARRRMDARHKQKKLENRLGEIIMLSSKLRQKLKLVEGR